jgi:hypothetical protein
MCELIELLFKAVAWLVLVRVYALWHLARLTVLALVYVINITVQLVQQHNSTEQEDGGASLGSPIAEELIIAAGLSNRSRPGRAWGHRCWRPSSSLRSSRRLDRPSWIVHR